VQVAVYKIFMVEHVVWVTTDRFKASTPGPNFINPRCFGEDFALWLRPRLAEQGLAVSEPIQEDWGWVILVTLAGHTFTVSIGVMDESIGQVPADWRIGVDHEKPHNRIRTWFKPAPVESLLALFQELQAVLVSEPQFGVAEEEP
jgi:hypothetical protein